MSNDSSRDRTAIGIDGDSAWWSGGFDPRPLTLVAAVAGVAILAIYAWIELRLPRGPQEFAYFPFMTDPMPFAPMRGFTFEQLVRHLGRIFLLGPALACLAYALVKVRRIEPPRPEVLRLIVIVAVGLSLMVTAAVMAGVLKGRAIVDDELAYSQQADLLRTGRLAENTVPPWGWEVFTVGTRLGATGKYLFGEPLDRARAWFAARGESERLWTLDLGETRFLR